TVDLAAPGQTILSTTNGSNSSYGHLSGTSMAAPHISGAAALLSALHPTLSMASLKATLMNTSDPLTGWEATPIKSNGRLNVFNALQDPTTCSLEVSDEAVLISRKGGYIDIEVTSPQNCDFRVSSDRPWIRLQGPGATSGTDSIRIFVDPSLYLKRAGSLSIGDTVVEVRQGMAFHFPK